MSRWLVIGLGPSLVRAIPALAKHRRYLPVERRVGVNDVNRHGVSVGHLVLLDPPEHFKTFERIDTIARSRPKHLWTNCGAQWPWIEAGERHQVHLRRCEDRSPEPLDDPGLCFAHCSPYAAVHVAYKQGATSIGMIGVDLVDHPQLKGDAVAKVDACFDQMLRALAMRGVELVNLSKISVLQSVPKVEIEDWCR